MGNNYLHPECCVMDVASEEEILTGSYTYGSAGKFGDGDIIDNGIY